MNEEKNFNSYSQQEIINYLNEINNDNQLLRKELKEQKEIIDSHYQILNIIMSNKFIKANGLLRNLQLHTLEMVRFVVNICEKYDFKYWLEFGSLIGAIRHEGFVPWDDEVDMAMPRKDYEMFLKVLPEEINRFDDLNEKVKVRKGSTVFKNAELEGKGWSPILQFLSRSPYAGLEVYPIDYVKFDEDSSISDFKKRFLKVKANFKKNYLNKKCTFEDGIIEGNKKVGITKEKTDFLSFPLDGSNRGPIPVSTVYPLKKCKFEGYEFYIPNKPIEHLSTQYGKKIMDIPEKIHHHNFVPLFILKREKGKNLDELYENTLRYWRNINDNFDSI